LNFAVLGNAPATLESLERLFSLTPHVRMLGRNGEAGHAAVDGLTTGIVLDGLEGGTDEPAVGARRIAVVLEDPVQLLAAGKEPKLGIGAPGAYTRTISPLLASLGDRALVIDAGELAQAGPALSELLEHLGLGPSWGDRALTIVATGRTPATGYGPALSAGHRARLFARVREDVEELERITGRTFRRWRFGGEIPESGPAPAARSLVYAGRRLDPDVPLESLVLDDWQVLPFQLGPLLERASCLSILDPMSFPFDALRSSDRDIPVAVQLPSGWDPSVLVQVLGRPVLDEITPFDLICTADDETWAVLRARYSWPAGIRVPLAGLGRAPQRLGGDPSGSARRQKSAYRMLAAATERRLDQARAAVPAGAMLSALVLADHVERWASLLSLTAADVIGVDHDPANTHHAAQSFPEWSFREQLPSGDDEVETAHIAVCVDALCSCEESERRRRLVALLRALRVGGRLIVVDQFFDGVDGRTDGGPTPRELMAEVSDAGARHLVLEHVEAHRLPGDDLTSAGVFAFIKLGLPERL